MYYNEILFLYWKVSKMFLLPIIEQSIIPLFNYEFIFDFRLFLCILHEPYEKKKYFLQYIENSNIIMQNIFNFIEFRLYFLVLL